MMKSFNSQKIKREEIGLTHCNSYNEKKYTDAKNDVAKYI